jgi:serine O-acetyltransferase
MPDSTSETPALDTLSLIRADLRRWHGIYGTYLYVIHPGCLAVLIYRIAHELRRHGPLGRLLSRALSLFNIIVTGADLHAGAEIGPGLFIPHSQATMFGEYTRAGANLTMYAMVLIGQGTEEGTGTTVGDNVTFWSRSSAFGAITIGDNVQVGAHSLVMSDVPADHNAVGSPARAIPQKASSGS